MEGSGLKEIIKSSAAGVEKMLTGKEFPANVTALRSVLLELLQGHTQGFNTHDEFEKWMAQLAATSELARQHDS